MIEKYLDTRATVFDIERYSTGDGPGIRTTVFLKGCPLSCEWCSNPESQNMKKEIMYYKDRCKDCGRCIEQCSQQAITKSEIYGLVTDIEKCTVSGKCADVCYYNAREVIGKVMSVNDVMEVIRRDKLFFEKSGGGVTISGGEPFLQADFVRGLLYVSKKEDINTAIETCGHVKWENIKKSLDIVDLFFFDIKHINSKYHKQITGVGNELILENLVRLSERHRNIIVRTPYIPGYNSDIKVLKGIFEFVAKLKNVIRIEIMPYHRFGSSKYEGLGREYKLKNIKPVKKQDLQYLVKVGKDCGINVHIGSI